MSARCPTCGHGTSGCLMTEEQWEALRDAAENTLSNLRSFRPGPDRQDDLIELLTAALEAIPG